MNKLTTFYLVRHGETEYNVKQIIQGQSDSQLTENGERQAQELAALFKGIKFDAIFSSDLARAKGTAEILNLNRRLAINTTKLLRERAFGHYEGQPREIFREQNKKLLEQLNRLSEQEKKSFKLYDSYESDTEIASRMITALREIALTYAGKNILVVSHGAIMRAFLVHLGFAAYNELPPESIKNSAYIKLESDGVDFFIKETKGVNKVKV